jgi:hypothetical protein
MLTNQRRLIRHTGNVVLFDCDDHAISPDESWLLRSDDATPFTCGDDAIFLDCNVQLDERLELGRQRCTKYVLYLATVLLPPQSPLDPT